MPLATRSHFVSALLVLLSSSCASAEGYELSSRAASDLHCAPEKLRTEELNEHSYRVRGCEREATYTCVRNGRRVSNDYSCIREAEHPP